MGCNVVLLRTDIHRASPFTPLKNLGRNFCFKEKSVVYPPLVAKAQINFSRYLFMGNISVGAVEQNSFFFKTELIILTECLIRFSLLISLLWVDDKLKSHNISNKMKWTRSFNTKAYELLNSLNIS